jgi:DNA-binding FadR family transcriptional regulator
VAGRLQAEIVEGRHAPGAELPSEGELSRAFGVSRTVLREAMRTLASKGLVTVAQGRAARVRPADPEVVVDSLGTFLRRNGHSPLALFEVRRPLEAEAAALAARRATPEHLAALEAALDRHERAKAAGDLIAADVAFHERLAEATENPVFLLLQRSLARRMETCLDDTLRRVTPDYGNGHRPIVAAVRARDPDAARRCMLAHLRTAEAKVKQAGMA